MAELPLGGDHGGTKIVSIGSEVMEQNGKWTVFFGKSGQFLWKVFFGPKIALFQVYLHEFRLDPGGIGVVCGHYIPPCGGQKQAGYDVAGTRKGRKT